jgi:hypothetical protein
MPAADRAAAASWAVCAVPRLPQAARAATPDRRLPSAVCRLPPAATGSAERPLLIRVDGRHHHRPHIFAQSHRMPLNLNPNFHERGLRPARDFTPGDDFYEALIVAHAGLTDEQSALLNARLVLLLSNQVGDLDVLREALALARRDLAPPAAREVAGR